MRQWLVEYRGSHPQEEVAENCNIHRGYYSLIELGLRTPSVSVAKRIANYLGFDWTIFFDNECFDSQHPSKEGSDEAHTA